MTKREKQKKINRIIDRRLFLQHHIERIRAKYFRARSQPRKLYLGKRLFYATAQLALNEIDLRIVRETPVLKRGKMEFKCGGIAHESGRELISGIRTGKSFQYIIGHQQISSIKKS